MIPKYRAWSNNSKEIYGVVYIDFKYGGVLLADKWDDIWADFEDVKLMQYTGFKDEKSVGVYEGDIVNVHWFYTAYDEGTLGRYEDEEEAKKVIITKEYGNLGFWWPEVDAWIDLSGLALQGGLHEESFEILGNIHENLGLVEKSE